MQEQFLAFGNKLFAHDAVEAVQLEPTADVLLRSGVTVPCPGATQEQLEAISKRSLIEGFICGETLLTGKKQG